MRGLPSDSPAVRLSKTLSYILRHGAEKEGVPMRDDGFVEFEDLRKNPKLTTLTVEALQEIVKSDAKQRYTLVAEGEKWFVRANQGHSMKTVQLTLNPILAVSDIPTGTAVHGTDRKAWEHISSQGLSKMRRNHIHLAQGLDAVSGIYDVGMRKNCTVRIWIDIQKALNDGLKFFLSDNGVILSEGNEEGFILPKYFSKIEDTRDGLLDIPSSA
ncbi:phosphotransferase KptA/Tpt1 [Cylindrobasidium torrendii FP15055 ss-10]|uniref:2'-phosphotransferase n=1 Tax=Cylindrobasidium torrendii FP15055 ss-10 TaxID=1314674 RepID=A0A0D7B2L5_9AGAR|nr:phosphotransferase KptA/Tpt1 [Cylindrobasidium torrendii FP15055 ss-10]